MLAVWVKNLKKKVFFFFWKIKSKKKIHPIQKQKRKNLQVLKKKSHGLFFVSKNKNKKDISTTGLILLIRSTKSQRQCLVKKNLLKNKNKKTAAFIFLIFSKLTFLVHTLLCVLIFFLHTWKKKHWTMLNCFPTGSRCSSTTRSCFLLKKVFFFFFIGYMYMRT